MIWDRAKGMVVELRSLVLASACISVGLIAVAGPPARGAFLHKYESQITEIPAEGPSKEVIPVPGALNPVGAMTTSAGDLYVDDAGRFDTFEGTTGTFLSQLSLQGGLADLEHGIALDTTTGETQLYAGTGSGGVVGVFGDGACGSLQCGVLQHEWTGADTPAGSFSVSKETGEPVARVEDVAVDDSASATDWAKGDVFVATASEFHGSFVELDVVDVFTPAKGGGETYVTQLTGPSPSEPFEDPTAVAVSGLNGDVLVFDGQPNKPGGTVDEFEPTGLNEYTFVRRIEAPQGQFSNTGVRLAIDEDTGDIYVAGQVIEGEGFSEPTVFEFSPSGEMVGSINGKETPAGNFSNITAVAVDAASGRVFVGDFNGEKGVVDEFGAGAVIPDVATASVSNAQPTSATFNGTVNPDGVAVVDCHFEYGETTSYGHVVPCSQSPAEIGSGSAPVAVSAEVNGLPPGVVYHYRLSASSVNGTNVATDQPFGPPRVSGESATCEAQTMATLEAQVNPDGVDTEYHFEYGLTPSYGTSIPQSPGELGAGVNDEAVNAILGSLQPGATYHYRVVAVNASGTAAGSDRICTTVPPAKIDLVEISEVTASTAAVHFLINPLGSDTTYHVEYGATTAYGTDLPVPDKDIGAGSGDVSLGVHLSGLYANTTYHVRVVATNALGVERSADHTFVYETSGETLPDNRAYEMVTPPQKNAALVGNIVHGLEPDVAESGSRLIFSSIQCFAEVLSCTGSRETVGSPYSFERTDNGWRTRSLAPAAAEYDANSGWLISADANTALFSMPTPPMSEDDFYAREPNGSLVDVGPATPPSDGAMGEPWGGGDIVSATVDFSHLVFQEGPLWPAASGSNGATPYEYVGNDNRAPTLVGVSGGPGSTDLISACQTELGGVLNTATPGALSADGHIVYFSAERCSSGTGANAATPVLVKTLYARVDETSTVKISEPSPSDCLSVKCRTSPPADALFAGASEDGSKAFFTSTQQLTDEASGASTNLYEYDLGAAAGHNLIDVSSGDTSGGPRVQGVAAISADGSHVYFVAEGVLTNEANERGASAEDGADNLYVYERDSGSQEGRLRFIATLPSNDAQHWSGLAERGANANVTPDGRYLVFTSHGDLTSDDTRRDGAQQVFRYDSQAGDLLRLSIGRAGFNDDGNGAPGIACESVTCPLDAEVVEPIEWGVWHAGPARRDPTMSHDGHYVFFRSPVGLTRAALNDSPIGNQRYADNVYEWHEGQIYLISDGKDTAAIAGFGAVKLLGSDGAGANVFFGTTDQLVPRDTDTQLDYYDARICTSSEPCIGEGPSSLAPCEGEACHGTPQAAPPTPAVSSATFSGQGNLGPRVAKTVKRKLPRCKRGFHRRRGKCMRGHHVRRRKARGGKAKARRGGR